MVCSPAEAEPALASCLSWLAGMVRSVCWEAEPPEWIFSIPAETTTPRWFQTHSHPTAEFPHSGSGCTCLASSCSDSAHQRPAAAAFSRANRRATLGHADDRKVAVAFGRYCRSSCRARQAFGHCGGPSAALDQCGHGHLRQAAPAAAATGCGARALGGADDGSLVGSHQEWVLLRCRLPSVSRLQGDTCWTVRRYTWSVLMAMCLPTAKEVWKQQS